MRIWTDRHTKRCAQVVTQVTRFLLFQSKINI